MPKGGKRGFRGGGRGGRGRQGRHGGRGGGHNGQRSGDRVEYPPVEKHNELFEKYYNDLGIIEEGEKEDFWNTLRRDLPSSFRFCGSKGHALSVQKRLTDHYIPHITSINYNDEPVEPPKPVPWFPDQLAYSMTTPKNVVRRFPPFASFQKFLVSETSVGNISRQEIVSMIPPLLMDIKPGMTVLDLCAAPGSKTAQLIEMIHRGEEARVRKVLRQIYSQEGRELSPDGFEIEMDMKEIDESGDWSDDGRSTGLVIANDADYKRAYMLIHQAKRLNSPNLIVTNHDATIFPSIRLPLLPPLPGQQPKTSRYLKFDRILADVPCSGDGTSRKNVNVWKDWTPQNSLGLHNTQVRILVRGLQMLKVGGRIVYSTCSMNPVENEAVVASAVERCGGHSIVKVLDVSKELPGLKRRPGLTHWNVMDKKGRTWRSWHDAQDQIDREGIQGMGRLAETQFPPSTGSDTERIPLERCMRVYGHFQDTGCFFIAVLEKQTEIKARPESEPKNPTTAATSIPATTEAAPAETDPMPSIIAIVDEIESQPVIPDNPAPKLDTLDEMLPPQPLPPDDSAAARQNREIGLPEPSSPAKRAQDDASDELRSLKRPKVRDDPDEIAPEGEGEELRRAHWPPPPSYEPDHPGVQNDFSHKHDNPTQAKKNATGQPNEEPFKFLSANHDELAVISDFYQLSERFPRDRFMVRNATGVPAKTIYYTSALARDILTQNEGKGIKFVHCGVKMFMKQDVQKEGTCKWRIQGDGLSIVEPWVGEKRIVRLYKRPTLRKLLKEMFPKVNQGGWEDLGEIGERVRDIELGCSILRVETSDAEDGFRERMVLPLWRSLHSLNLMLPKDERKAMLLRLYDDDSPIEDSSKDRKVIVGPETPEEQDDGQQDDQPEEASSGTIEEIPEANGINGSAMDED